MIQSQNQKSKDLACLSNEMLILNALEGIKKKLHPEELAKINKDNQELFFC